MAVDRGGLVSCATSKMGKDYVGGGTTDAGYDCSGLIYTAYQNQGSTIPRTAQAQYYASSKVNTNNLQSGDLVFFSDTGSVDNVTHVGMYIGNNQYVHAANSQKGVIVSTLNTSGNYFVGAGSLGELGGSSSTDYQYTPGIAGTPIGGLINAWGESIETGNAVTVDGYTVEAVGLKDKLLDVLGNILKFVTLLGVFALAAIFFMKSFDIKIGGMKP